MSDLEDVKITKEEVEPRQVRLTVEVPQEEVEREMRRAARQLAREVRIPGFRPGKAPYRVIVQRYGEDALRVEAAENLIEELFPKVLESEDLHPFAPPELESMELEPFEFVVLVSLSPEVDLGDYESLRIDIPSVEVEESEVDEVLERLRETHAVLEPVEDRGAEPGDMVVISVEGITDEGEPFLKDEGVEVILDPENENPVPGFYEELVGMQVGEERTFRLPLPEEHAAEGGEFTVELEGLADRVLADLNDDLARAVGDYDTLEELKQDIRDQIRERREAEAEEEYLDAMIGALVDQAEIEYPPIAMEEELDSIIENFEQRIQRDLRMSLDDYLKAVDKTKEELRSEFQPQAQRNLETGLVLTKLVKLEDLSVDQEEIEERIEERLESLGPRASNRREWLQSLEGRLSTESKLLAEKAIDRLRAIARGEGEKQEKEESAEESED